MEESVSLFEANLSKNMEDLSRKQKTDEKIDAVRQLLEAIFASPNEIENQILESQMNRNALETEQQRRYLALAEQDAADRRMTNAMNEARNNIGTLLHFFEKGMNKDIPNYDEILENNVKVLGNISTLVEAAGLPVKENEVNFHLTENDLKKSLRKTNILEVMRTAKKNGWEVRLTDNEVTLFKDGKAVGGKTLKKYFVEIEEKGAPCKTATAKAIIKSKKQLQPVTAKAKRITRKS